MALIGKISPHFTWQELLKSNDARKYRISNQPSPMAAANLARLSYLVLEPLRTHFGRPYVPSSGYRSPALNKAIGGSDTSNHSLGCAVDGEFKGIDNYEVAEWCAKNLPHFDEVILEQYTGGNTGWIHLALRPENNRRKVLTWDGVNYMRGLVR